MTEVGVFILDRAPQKNRRGLPASHRLVNSPLVKTPAPILGVFKAI